MSVKSESTSTRHVMPKKQLLAVSIGNAVEWYDWTVYATFSIYFATQIFSGDNPAVALLSTLATYSVAFFFRPLGGLLIGRFSDLRGRRQAMILTIAMMSGGSFAIAALPTFAVAGWIAPILLLLARILQGMSMGGEVSNASAYLAEIAPNDRRGRYSSFYYISTGTAILLASLLGAYLTFVLDDDQLSSWGWRVPFVIGGLLGVVGLWMRRGMAEADNQERNAVKAKAVRNPLWMTMKHHPRSVLQVVGFVLLATLAYYTFFSAMTPYAVKQRGADANDVFVALSIATAMFVALQYPMGALADRIGRKPQLLTYAALFAILIIPLSKLIGPSFVKLLIVFCVGLLLFAMCSSIIPAVLAEAFPAELRGVGIGAWYNLTVALFGGTAPLLVNALSEKGHADWFFYYLAAAAVISFLTMVWMPEKRGQDLD
jgi:MHS family alpha-ketoglutarate permease-like MFS transporter